MKIVVLAGGLSPERDVSLSSGSLIANALMENGHDVYLLDLYLGVDKNPEDIVFINNDSNQRYSYLVPATEPDLDELKANHGESLIGKNVIELCKMADKVFIALHGDIGENGKLQAIFDTFEISYTGTGYVGSLLAMDKDIAKTIMVQNKILTPEWELVKINQNIAKKISFPCVIKPCSCGSSIGVSIVNNDQEFVTAIESAKKYEDMIIIEKMIKGREFSVSVLGKQALPAIEIIPNEGFYDYKHKYQPGITKEICPADIPNELSEKLKKVALQVHKKLRLGSYSRIDFIVDNKKNIYCLEANTLPGMTPTSLLPQEAKAVGISYNGLCEKIVNS